MMISDGKIPYLANFSSLEQAVDWTLKPVYSSRAIVDEIAS
jgi:hypothetical protein